MIPGGVGPGTALIVLLAILVWIVVLVWLGARVQTYVGRRTGWGRRSWRSLLASIVLLTAAIHLGNRALDWIERAFAGGDWAVPLGFPSAFLIGSVAIGCGVAWVRGRRR